MADDILEKGAILQRDKTSYAIAPHIPGGIITDFNLLRHIADVAEKYGVKAIKLTSAQRLALVGVKQEELDQIWSELGLVPGAAIGLCVRSVKICPGTDFCRIAMQDAVGVGKKVGRGLTVSYERRLTPLEGEDVNQIRLNYKIRKYLSAETQLGRKNPGGDLFLNIDF